MIQECRIERTKALAATNDSEFADRRYIACLDMSKKNKQLGFVIPKEIAYALILSVLGGAFAAYNQLQTVDRRLQTIESEINVLIQ